MRKKIVHSRTARAASLLLTAAMAGTLLAGCSKDDAGNGDSDSSRSGKGRFMEEELSLPDGIDEILAVRTLEDGSIAVVGQSTEKEEYYLLNSKDMGTTWSSVSLTELDGANTWISVSAIAPDGSAVLYGMDTGSEEWTNSLWKVSPEGALETVPLDLPEIEDGDTSGQGTFYQKEVTYDGDGDTEGPAEAEEGVFPENVDGTETDENGAAMNNWYSTNDAQQLEYDDEGNLFCLDIYGEVYRVNIEDGSVEEAFDREGHSIQYFGIAGHTFLGGTMDGEILIFDTATGEELEQQVVLDESGSKAQADYLQSVLYENVKPMLFTAGADGSIIYANSNGIYRYNMGGSVSEQLADGALSSLGDPSNGLQMMTMPDANHILVLMYGKEGPRLMHYSYDENVTAVPDQELTIYALEDSMALRQAVSLFREKYPNVYVDLQIGLSEEGMTREDALTALNTDIMAGNGPDVVMLDGMQLDSYVDKEVLSDITDVVDEIAESDGIFENIRNAYERDGKLYAIPTRFQISVVAGNKDAVAAGGNMKTLADWVANAQGTVFASQTREEMLKELYQAFSATWQKEDGSLDEEALKDFLSNARSITAAIDSEGSGAANYQENIAGGGYDSALSGIGIHLLLGEAQLEIGTAAGMEDIQMLRSLSKETGGSYAVCNSDNGGSFIPYLTVGVLSKGNTDMAKEFVKALLGSELDMSNNGFPVNKAAYAKRCENAMRDDTEYSQSIMAISDENGQIKDVKITPLTQEEVDEVTAVLESLSLPSLTDATIENQVLEQAAHYVSGGQELEETVSSIQQKVNLYLAE